MGAVIFANGELDHPEAARALITRSSLIIAADGGSRHCQALGIIPHILIGDMDSIEPELLQEYEIAGVEIIQFPARKDFNDLELALRLAQERGADEVVVVAALGNRWDHTLVNVLLPAEQAFAGLKISLVDGPQEMLLVHAGRRLHVLGQPGDTVSLIPLAGDARGITTHGLEYPLAEGELKFGSSRGVSNVLLGTEAEVWLREGLLLCVVIHQQPVQEPLSRENHEQHRGGIESR